MIVVVHGAHAVAVNVDEMVVILVRVQVVLSRLLSASTIAGRGGNRTTLCARWAPSFVSGLRYARTRFFFLPETVRSVPTVQLIEQPSCVCLVLYLCIRDQTTKLLLAVANNG